MSLARTDWLKLEKKNFFILFFFLIMQTGGRAVCLSVCLSVIQTFCLSVGWLVRMCACIHTYDHVCIYADRQTADRQTACMHVCTDIKKERKKSLQFS